MRALAAGNGALPSFTILGEGGPFRLEAPASAVAGGVQAGPITATPAQEGVSPSFPDTVGVQTLGLWWTLKWERDGRSDQTHVGPSATKVYRAAGPPATQPLFETLLHLGCNAASGLSGDDEQALVDAVWSEFADREVRRADGVQMGYYRGVTCNCDAPANFTSAALIRETDGRCGAWANLLRKVLLAQSIPGNAVEIIGVTADENVLPGDCRIGGHIYGIQLLVARQQFTPPAQADCPDYPYRYDHPCIGVHPCGALFATSPWPAVDVTDLAGIEAQNNPNPVSWFPDHAIVRYRGKYYDPSYGEGPFASPLAWEDAAIAGLAGYKDMGMDHNGNPMYRLGSRPDVSNVLECTFAVTPDEDHGGP